MPLIVDRNQVPSRWLERKHSDLVQPMYSGGARSKCVRIALINNMPDSALEDTELQFFELLDAASEDLPVFVRLYSLTDVPRGDRGMRHLSTFYFGLDDLWKSDLDGAIITGTEPHHENLKEEPYWSQLSSVLDWAERSTTSTILSCLAAHASVLYSDGVNRRRLPDKQFGVFPSNRICAHPLLENLPLTVEFPHSRWNEVRETDLLASGYTVLTKSPAAGVDLFVKKKSRSTFVYFQGHPEYGSETLFREYRRDIKRFLRKERNSYPSMPFGYFDTEETDLLSGFQQDAVLDRCEEAMDAFPELACKRTPSKWHLVANSIYRNWLRQLTHREEASTVASFTGGGIGHASMNGEIA